jgi:hypothetical protein
MPAPLPAPPNPNDDPDGSAFSLVRGGPLFDVYRRARLADDGLGLTPRRVIAAVLVLWAPLMVLAALQGRLVGGGLKAPLIEDIGFQLRFLAVTPLLILAERVVHRRMQPIVAQFRLRGLVRPDQAGRFTDAVGEANRWRDSRLAEVLLLVVVYVVDLTFTASRYRALSTDGWYALPSGVLSLAGDWAVFVSLPVLQFLLLRWYFRLLVWGRFLWRISRLDLDLNATHPDKAGGLGFLGESLIAFIPLAAAHGLLFAGALADRILFHGAKLAHFQMEVAAGAAFLLVAFVGPLLLLGPRLGQVKRRGLREYGAVGQTYVAAFRQRWMSGRASDEPLLGSGDLQSLADLGNSNAAAEQMRLVPVQLGALAAFLVAFLAPLAPLLLTMMSAEALLNRLVGIVF